MHTHFQTQNTFICHVHLPHRAWKELCSTSGPVQQFRGGSEADYRRDRKKMQETDTGGLQVITMPAPSVFLTAFLYYSTVGSKASRNKLAEIYTFVLTHTKKSLFLPPRSTESSGSSVPPLIIPCLRRVGSLPTGADLPWLYLASRPPPPSHLSPTDSFDSFV